MQFAKGFKQTIFEIDERNFESKCLAVFQYQYNHCAVYQKYCNLIGRSPETVKILTEIPFLPIEFYKNHAIKSGNWEEEKIFLSSGTTATGRSKHYINDLHFYKKLSKQIFESYYGSLTDLQIVALLPSYQEAGDSSLIAMVDHFMEVAHPNSTFLSVNNLNAITDFGPKMVFIGVSYALLEAAEMGMRVPSEAIIMETGGMKGRRKEITRSELHRELIDTWNVKEIHSEYGMTELLSQGYGKGGHFRFPSWAKVLIRDINDPFCYLDEGKTGGINVIDLANVDSCSFIETKDLGKVENGKFEVLGRFDNSDIRGCNLLF